MQKGSYLKILLELGKVRISLPVALSALTGYLMFTKKLDQGAWLLAFGVFLVSCGSSAFNHFQEREQDALMPRTKKTPNSFQKVVSNSCICCSNHIYFNWPCFVVFVFTSNSHVAKPFHTSYL